MASKRADPAAHLVRAYLFTITRNLYRDQGRGSQVKFGALNEDVADRKPGADARIEHKSSLQSLRTKLRRVAPGDRRALLLFVLQDKPYAEIADVLGVSVGAVKSRIARAREALRTAPHGRIRLAWSGPSGLHHRGSIRRVGRWLLSLVRNPERWAELFLGTSGTPSNSDRDETNTPSSRL